MATKSIEAVMKKAVMQFCRDARHMDRPVTIPKLEAYVKARVRDHFIYSPTDGHPEFVLKELVRSGHIEGTWGAGGEGLRVVKIRGSVPKKKAQGMKQTGFGWGER